jgi:hypothetical protein
MSYEITCETLTRIGADVFSDGYFTETYGTDDETFFGTYGNEISFDSYSTFDSDDYEFMQTLA